MLNAMTIKAAGPTTEDREESFTGIGFADEAFAAAAADPRWDDEPAYSPEEIEDMYQAHLAHEREATLARQAAAAELFDQRWAAMMQAHADEAARIDREIATIQYCMENLPETLARLL